MSTSKRAAPEPQPKQCDAEACETGCACPGDCIATPAAHELETVDAIGVRADGTQDALGKVAMPPKMKARELVREYFGGIVPESESEMALFICEDLIDWMARQDAAQAGLAPQPHEEERKAFYAAFPGTGVKGDIDDARWAGFQAGTAWARAASQEAAK